MRRFLEIKQGRHLAVAQADAEKNMETIKLSPVHDMHSMHKYAKQIESKAILFENMNLLKRLEKVDSEANPAKLAKDYEKRTEHK